MSGISSGVGIISGINRQQLIDQLIAIEARPVQTLQTRLRGLDAQRTAYLGLSASVLSAQNAALRFTRVSLFRSFKAASSNESVLAATAGETATAGSHTFRVRSLAANHALLSRGFTDANVSPVGTGSLSIEFGNGRVDRSNELDSLRGGQGIRRGVIRITDRAGGTAEIDLSAAVTIDDVLNAVNASPGIRVRAVVTGLSANGATGDRIVIEDLSGGTGNLAIADLPGGFAAADLGIAGSVADNRLDGSALIQLTQSKLLSSLNDGNGVGRLRAGRGDDLTFSTTYGDFNVSLSGTLKGNTDLRVLNGGNGVRLGVIRITDRSGKSADIDLSNALTIQDIADAVEAADVAATVNFDNLQHLQILDTSAAPTETVENLRVEDVSGFAAADLGILGDVSDTKITGKEIHRVSTIGDVLRAINFAEGNRSTSGIDPVLVRASISENGKGVKLEALGFQSVVNVTSAQNASGFVSTALQDLGLENASNVSSFQSRDLIAGLNTVLLRSVNGGAGAQSGVVRLTDLSDRTTTIDFSAARTLRDVIDLINADESTSLVASLNASGTGIEIRDESGGTSTGIRIEDVTGSLAADLRIATPESFGGGRVSGGNLQLQYISRQTLLKDLNGGRGVSLGSFTLTDSTGATYTIHLPANAASVGDVIDEINGATPGSFIPDTIEARINDTGDGIIIIDHAGGAGKLTVQDINGGRAAADLRLAGSAAPGENRIDGTAEVRVQLNAADTLNDLARKLNEADEGVVATILNRGGQGNPFGLTLASSVSGRRGELIVHADGVDLGLDTLTRAQDAVLSVGGASPLLVTSSTNTVDDLFQGISVELRAANPEDVTVTVAQDVDSIVSAVREFVDAYNEVHQAIDDGTSFNNESFERGPLLGDGTVNLVRSRLQRVVSRSFGADPSLSRLFNVGVRSTRNNRLEFNEQTFRDVYAESPEKVEELFTRDADGFGKTVSDALTELTKNFDGVLTRKDDLLREQQESVNRRIETLNERLDVKRARLEAQFSALESSLAALQNQQNALASLANRIPG